MAENFTADYQQIKHNFLEELTKASRGERSSIPFIKNQLPKSHFLRDGIAQGIVIGGTNYIANTVLVKDNEQIKVIKITSGVLPIFNTVEVLITFLLEHMHPDAQAIGINFGFPVKPVVGSNGELDSQLITGTKEHLFEGLTDPVGQITKQLFAQKYHKHIPVSVANDTICLTLADKSNNGSLIVGTGFNMALRYAENNKHFIVNLEAGNFDKFEMSESLQYIDQHSEMPGKQLFEKGISGKYLSEHFNLLAQQIEPNSALAASTRELSAYAESNTNEAIKHLANTIIEHAAKQVAAAIAANYEFSKSPKKFELIGEGSLLWKGFNFQKILFKQLEEFGIPPKTITITEIPDSSIQGAFGLII